MLRPEDIVLTACELLARKIRNLQARPCCPCCPCCSPGSARAPSLAGRCSRARRQRWPAGKVDSSGGVRQCSAATPAVAAGTAGQEPGLCRCNAGALKLLLCCPALCLRRRRLMRRQICTTREGRRPWRCEATCSSPCDGPCTEAQYRSCPTTHRAHDSSCIAHASAGGGGVAWRGGSSRRWRPWHARHPACSALAVCSGRGRPTLASLHHHNTAQYCNCTSHYWP